MTSIGILRPFVGKARSRTIDAKAIEVPNEVNRSKGIDRLADLTLWREFLSKRHAKAVVTDYV